MLDFRAPKISDKLIIQNLLCNFDFYGSDASFANIYLLQKKYDTKICIKNNFLFRYYNGEGSRKGYAFPIGNGDVFFALKLICMDSFERNVPLEFCLIDESRLNILSEFFKNKLVIKKNRGDSDYIYNAKDLSSLNGNKYRKKRNHFSRFVKTYNDYKLEPITKSNIQDVLQIETLWMNVEDSLENLNIKQDNQMILKKEGSLEDAIAEYSENKSSKIMEYNSIVESLKYYEELGLKGAILYVNKNPIAMTIASQITQTIWDIHFEKVIGEYAINGGYTAINKLFVQTLENVEFVNREEDINLEGLRKAKLSYYPHMILDKFHVTIDSSEFKWLNG